MEQLKILMCAGLLFGCLPEPAAQPSPPTAEETPLASAARRPDRHTADVTPHAPPPGPSADRELLQVTPIDPQSVPDLPASLEAATVASWGDAYLRCGNDPSESAPEPDKIMAGHSPRERTAAILHVLLTDKVSSARFRGLVHLLAHSGDERAFASLQQVLRNIPAIVDHNLAGRVGISARLRANEAARMQAATYKAIADTDHPQAPALLRQALNNPAELASNAARAGLERLGHTADPELGAARVALRSSAPAPEGAR